MSEFKWDDNLAKEYGNFLVNERVKWFNTFNGEAQPIPESLLFEQFKKSKASVPEWEIQSCFNKHNSETHYYKNKNTQGFSNCDDDKCKIQSVKRVSDGLIFSVGDSIIAGGEIRIIEELFTHSSYNTFYARTPKHHSWDLKSISKVPERIPEPETVPYASYKLLFDKNQEILEEMSKMYSLDNVKEIITGITSACINSLDKDKIKL